MFAPAFVSLLLVAITAARELSPLQIRATNTSDAFSHSVANCPGYKLGSLKESANGLTAKLALAGAACNAFGHDVSDLTIQVTYETQSRLHVKISDTADKQYTIPDDVISLDKGSKSTTKQNSDLVFNYNSAPFAFWITRRSDPKGEPLFDTRLSSLPKTPIPPVITSDNSTALDGFPLVFEDQYLQLTSALPLDTNIYGLGEVVASSGIRRDVKGGSVQTMWARDIADPVDENVYGSHPVYIEHRFNQKTGKTSSHGVFLFNAAGSDILLLTPPGSTKSLIEYRLLGGVLDFYFLSGPTPQSVIEQYGALVGLPTWQPIWGFGFHLCRWGYSSIAETELQVTNMRAANIPLEVMWNDIDLYHAVRDFTADPVSFAPAEVKAFTDKLHANHQRYIPIVDAAIPKQVNSSDLYAPYLDGAQKKVFITNPDGSEYVGQVWPGYTVFPDWFAKNTQDWWTESLKNWTELGVQFDGIWLDMNEASSFCDGSCGSNADLSRTAPPFILPGEPGNPVTDYPECYDAKTFGPSGNVTVNGTSTCTLAVNKNQRRGLGAGHQNGTELNVPPYTIHNAFGRLSEHALATNATHAGGIVELDVHNLWGMMEEKATHLALNKIQPGTRPFLISRSTFASSGKWSGHWLGDNFSLWEYLRYSIQGVLQFQIFQIPMVGADTCGFVGNTDEELCNRWMQLSAFTPFYRNHNIKGAISQEPYRWDSVANASRTAIATRYSMLPYWYTLFATASTKGTPPVRALFMEFPDEPELFAIDRQFLIGRDILVSPALEPSVTTVQAVFPGRGKVTWRDWYTHDVVKTTGVNTTLAAPLGHINVHVRDGAAILLHSAPAYTITETRDGPFSILVSLDSTGAASGSAFLDDGVSFPVKDSKTLTLSAAHNQLHISGTGSFHVAQKVDTITLLGVKSKPRSVTINGRAVSSTQYLAAQQKVVLSKLSVDLNSAVTVAWH